MDSITLPAEHDQHLAGLVKSGGLQRARVKAIRWRGDERPGGDFARRHNPQGRVGRLKARAVSMMVFGASGEQEQSRYGASLKFH
jgi:hypothetical protein